MLGALASGARRHVRSQIQIAILAKRCFHASHYVASDETTESSAKPLVKKSAAPARSKINKGVKGSQTRTLWKKDDDKQSATGKRAISLLEELFPSAAPQTNSSSNTDVKPTAKPTREIPKVPLEPAVLPEDDHQRDPLPARQQFQRFRQNRLTAVLILRKASKFLTKSDFSRNTPGARHIEGWTGENSILNVIRGRNSATLRPDGTYYIIFDNSGSAQSYREYVKRLHRASKMALPGYGDDFSGTSRTGIPPPPQLGAHGRLSYSWSETYTLMPPSHELDLVLNIPPFSPLLRQIIENSGYRPLTEDRKTEHEVLVLADWGQLTLGSLSRAVAVDGRNRGIHWATLGNRTGIRELNLPLPPQHTFSGIYHHMLDGADEDEPGPTAPARDDSVKRFIVSFREEAEAKRFALAWHQRDIKRLLEDSPPHRPSIVTEAEVIW